MPCPWSKWYRIGVAADERDAGVAQEWGHRSLLPGNRMAAPSRQHLSVAPKSCNSKPFREHWFPINSVSDLVGRDSGTKTTDCFRIEPFDYCLQPADQKLFASLEGVYLCVSSAAV